MRILKKCCFWWECWMLMPMRNPERSRWVPWKVLRQILGSSNNSFRFWWESWKDSNKNIGKIIMIILEKFYWESWKHSNYNHGRIQMRIFKECWWESRKDSDESVARNPGRKLLILIKIVHECLWKSSQDAYKNPQMMLWKSWKDAEENPRRTDRLFYVIHQVGITCSPILRHVWN